eukprot:CAMPEP_0168555300 /NCGR_PEP_ID=MMETSP0413-20121227/8255_1 /TAXON_ID=136452 /ORGANISM="Filamoeba nolandi, Strain NC-AS-23-1" /LENGTH=644 /DNA_ID=CAMNT_0008586129 /DNA_START=51 /DNA_END=1985 /DNA_ORIENTATION=-
MSSADLIEDANNLEQPITASDLEKVVEEGLFNLLLPQDVQSKISEDDQRDYENYLATLTTYSLERLNKEPSNLSHEHASIKQQMEELAFTNYKAFIQTSTCLQNIHGNMGELNVHVNNMLHNLPNLSAGCKEFATKAQAINKRRGVNRNTLQNYTTILELLEIPQLMDTCVRNGLYDEALELEAYTQKLAKQHPKNSIIADIREEVTQSTEVMLFQLHQQLKSAIQLPVCLRVVGFLRRLGLYTDSELRMCFLQCRSSFLTQSILQSIPTSNPYTYLTKLTDNCRTHLSDIITQYRAIFSDDSSLPDEPMDDGLLYGWMNKMITDYLTALDKFLPQVQDGLALSNTLDQCMYFGVSLGRVGVDFRGLLLPIFEKAIFSMFSSQIAASTSYFIDTIRSPSFKFVPPSKQLQYASALDNKDQFSPPFSLLDYPPLAVLANGYITALNELRQCAPLSLSKKLADRLGEGLYSMAVALQSFKKEPFRPLDQEETKVFSSMCQAAAERMIPHTARCFDSVYHSAKSLVDTSKALSVLETMYEKQFKSEPLSIDLSTLDAEIAAEAAPADVTQQATTSPRSEGIETQIANEEQPTAPSTPRSDGTKTPGSSSPRISQSPRNSPRQLSPREQQSAPVVEEQRTQEPNGVNQ